MQICGRGFFKIFLFLQMRSNDTEEPMKQSFKKNIKLKSINTDRLKV